MIFNLIYTSDNTTKKGWHFFVDLDTLLFKLASEEYPNPENENSVLSSSRDKGSWVFHYRVRRQKIYEVK